MQMRSGQCDTLSFKYQNALNGESGNNRPCGPLTFTVSFWEQEATERGNLALILRHIITNRLVESCPNKSNLKYCFVTHFVTEHTRWVSLGWRSHVVPSSTSQRHRVDHRTGLLPGQQSTNPRAAEDEDPPHSRHSQKTMKIALFHIKITQISVQYL